LTQQGQAVTIVSGDALTAQRPATMTISGRYQQSNAAPMAFKLNDKTCETFVSSKPGEPSRPVEHLSNGTTRLGPLPTTGPRGGAVGPTPTLHPILAHSLPPTTPQFTTPPTTSQFTAVVPPGRPQTTTPTTTQQVIPPTGPPPLTADPTTPTTDSPTPSP
jgi:serine/threonine-protein kinase